MRPMNMKNATSQDTIAPGAGAGCNSIACARRFRCGSRNHRHGGHGRDFQSDRPGRLPEPARRKCHLLVGIRLRPASLASFLPKARFAFTPTCNTMQVPGPTMIVTEGQPVTINLTNNLPTAAGNTSILFPGFNVSTSCTAATPAGQQGLLTCEAAPGSTVTYTFTASTPGTHAYYSGTQGDLQVEMGLYGAIVVLPKAVPASCNTTDTNLYGKSTYLSKIGLSERVISGSHTQPTTTLRAAMTGNTCFSGRRWMPGFTTQAEAQVQAKMGCSAGTMGCSLDVQTEPYHPAYFLINGRSMPDLMDPNYASRYPHQPYNGNPHMHPGELTLIRTIGQGRWQHPFHEHANHVRILARDGNLHLSPTESDVESRRTADVQHRHHSGRGVRRHLLLHRQGIELGSVWSSSRGHRQLYLSVSDCLHH